MPKQYIFTKGPEGTSVAACASEELAIKLCILAIASGCWFAFYSE